MGLHVLLKPRGRILDWNSALKEKTLAAISLLNPLKDYIVPPVLIYVYKGMPYHEEVKHYLVEKIETGATPEKIRMVLASLLERYLHTFRHLYGSTIVVSFGYKPPILEKPFGMYLAVYNNEYRNTYGDYSLDGYTYYRGEEKIDGLLDFLKAFQLKDLAYRLLSEAAHTKHLMDRDPSRYRFTVHRAVLSEDAEALNKLNEAIGFVVASKPSILSYAYDTMKILAEEGDEDSANAYEYLRYVRKDVLVNIAGNHPEFEPTLIALAHRGELALVSGSLIVLNKNLDKLDKLYRLLVKHVLLPFGKEVIERRYKDLKDKAYEVLRRELSKARQTLQPRS